MPSRTRTAVRPFLPEAYFSPRIWGTRDLSAWYPERGPEPEPIGEAWLTADVCTVLGGAAADLATIARVYPEELFGPEHGTLDCFPLLVKFLFPEDVLSVQVHPDDDYAAAHGLGRGKTEMWHVVEARPGAKLAVNLLPGVTMADLERACREGCSSQLLDWLEVAAGDTIFLPAGTIHAIGPGMVLCEVQQQSDNTFRLDDYGRLDASGRRRELHLEHGLRVARPHTQGGRVHSQGPLLVESPYFRVRRHNLEHREQKFAPAFRIVVTLAGDIYIGSEAGNLNVPRARAAVIPHAAGETTITGTGTILDVTLP